MWNFSGKNVSYQHSYEFLVGVFLHCTPGVASPLESWCTRARLMTTSFEVSTRVAYESLHNTHTNKTSWSQQTINTSGYIINPIYPVIYISGIGAWSINIDLKSLKVTIWMVEIREVSMVLLTAGISSVNMCGMIWYRFRYALRTI